MTFLRQLAISMAAVTTGLMLATVGVNNAAAEAAEAPKSSAPPLPQWVVNEIGLTDPIPAGWEPFDTAQHGHATMANGYHVVIPYSCLLIRRRTR